VRHHVYLIPGFFGFVNFGRLIYFGHVCDALGRELAARRLDVALHRVSVSPTASIRTRAAQLHAQIAETADGDGPIHLIGHSTGGLDARLMVTPSAALDPGVAVEAVTARVRTVVTVATPHLGAPLASLFTGLFGQQLLRLLSLATMATLRQGRLPMSLLARLGAAFARTFVPGGAALALLEQLQHELVRYLPGDERGAIADFVHGVGSDQALLVQLCPGGIDLLNASAGDRPAVRYACVVTRARPPTLRGQIGLGRSMSAHATYLLYRALHRQAAAPGLAPPLTASQRERLVADLGQMPSPRDSDGIVPTLSQIHGEVLAAVQADHLDVIGHFDDERRRPPHHDWLTTRSGFGYGEFHAVWARVAGAIAASTAGPGQKLS